MNFNRNNYDKGIIKLILIISYFLIFSLVITLAYIVYMTFFTYRNIEQTNYQNYTGSIIVGEDIAPGEYKISSADNDKSDDVYGIKSRKMKEFEIVNFENSEVITLSRNQHLIVYNATLTPITSVDRAFVDADAQSVTSTTSNEVMIKDVDMVKLTKDFYRVPYIVNSNGDDSYVELLDEDGKSLTKATISSERLMYLEPKDGRYIRANDIDIEPLRTYQSDKQMENGYFPNGVYEIGRDLEAGKYLLSAKTNSCQYRIIESSKRISSTPLMQCPTNEQSIELEDGQILETVDARLTIDYQFNNSEDGSQIATN